MKLWRMHAPRYRQGFTVFLTGLCGSGKSTIARMLEHEFLKQENRQVTLLDGDLTRKLLYPDLGFSRADRDTNVRRVGFVAAEVTKSTGIAICALIAPYDATRKEVRALIQTVGAFILVHVDAPIEVCESRDHKGLYAKARAGLIEHFTGVSDPYERPQDAEVVLKTAEQSPEQAMVLVLDYLRREGYLHGGEE